MSTAAADEKTVEARCAKEHIAVGVVGCEEGDELVAIPTTAMKNTRIKIVKGFCCPSSEMVNRFCLARGGEVRAAEALASYWDVGFEEAFERFRNHNRGHSNGAHQPFGKTCSCDCRRPTTCLHEPECRFVIISPGTLYEYCEEFGTTDLLVAAVDAQRALTWKDLYQWIGNHTLSFHPGWYTVDRSGESMTVFEGGQWMDLSSDSSADGSVFEERVALTADECRSFTLRRLGTVDQKFVVKILLATAMHKPSREGLKNIALSLVACRCNNAEQQFALAFCWLEKFTIGPLKSALQKIIRFGAPVVVLQAGLEMDADVFLCACIIELILRPGMFIPELQVYSRGIGAAFKRVVMCAFEDAWPSSSLSQQQSAKDLPLTLLLAVSWCAEKNRAWFPPPSVYAKLFALAITSRRSVVALEEDTTDVAAAPKKKAKKNDEDANNAAAATATTFMAAFHASSSAFDSVAVRQSCAFLMRSIGSFRSDMALLDAYAKMETLRYCTASIVKDKMPLEHVVDQHAFRSIGTWLPGRETHVVKHKLLFEETTGVNPRRFRNEDDVVFEEEARSIVRDAQRKCMMSILPSSSLSSVSSASSLTLPMEQVVLEFQHDTGTLAACAGAREVKIGNETVLVVLGTEIPEQEVVLRKPTRSTKIITDLTNSVKEAAIEKVRSSEKIRSCLPNVLSGTIRFSQTCRRWCLNDKPWMSQVFVRRAYVLPVGWLDLLKGIVLQTPADAVYRWLALTEQQFLHFSFPLPSLKGGVGSDDLQPFPWDHDALTLCLAIQRLIPAAFSMTSSVQLSFKITDSLLLRYICRVVMQMIRSTSSCLSSSSLFPSSSAAKWQTLGALDNLMPHQRDAYLDMRYRHDHGHRAHFLVMDTGLGKTRTTARFLFDLRQKLTGCLWVVTEESVDGICEQLRACSVPSHVVKAKDIQRIFSLEDEPPKKKRKVAAGVLLSKEDCHGSFLVIGQDQLRLCVETLMMVIPTMALVVDECDGHYAATKRTSASMALASMAEVVVCQTATAIRNGSYEGFARWLSKCVNYPVTAAEWPVVAGDIVSKFVELGITMEHEVITVQMSREDVRQMGTYYRERAWIKAARVAWASATEQLLDVIEEKSARHGGVLAVAWTKEEAERWVTALRMRSGGDVFAAATMEDGSVDSRYRNVVITMKQCRGYNWAVRLGAIVRSAYPSNSSSRHQLFGRLRRVGQTRSIVYDYTVVPKGSIVELLLERQNVADTANVSIEQLAEKYSGDVLMMLAGA